MAEAGNRHDASERAIRAIWMGGSQLLAGPGLDDDVGKARTIDYLLVEEANRLLAGRWSAAGVVNDVA
jgi:hypothetical protein